MATPRISIPEITESQGAKYITHNEALRKIESMLCLSPTSIANTPTSSAEGDVFIVGTAPTGGFAGQANKIAHYTGGVWQFYTPRTGFIAGVASVPYIYTGSAWQKMTASVSSAAPATATSAGSAGDISFDAGFIYICIATNVWKRTGVLTW